MFDASCSRRDSGFSGAHAKGAASKQVRLSMRAHKSSIFLVKSAPSSVAKACRFRTGESIPRSGVYRVFHRKHRLPHEVTLLREEEFPRCAKCQDAVTFQLLKAAQEPMEAARARSFRVRLYELPVEEAEENAMAV